MAAASRPRSPKGRARAVAALLAEDQPVAVCELEHRNAFELLAATILSAQCTDARVNLVTPALFDRYPDAAALAVADHADVEEIVRSTGFFASKARNLIAMAAALVDRHGGEVPRSMAALVELPGVGRKTANLVRVVAFSLPGLVVDTHVVRVANRLALTASADAGEIERELGKLLPAAERGSFGLRMIIHGRRVCAARRPACGSCCLVALCPSRETPVQHGHGPRARASHAVHQRGDAPRSRRSSG
jgi:endonuclease III